MFCKKIMLLLWPCNYRVSQMFSSESKKVLDQQVALVIGSTHGIGLAVARRLAQDGATVLLNSRKQENVDRAVRELTEEGLNVSGTTCHVGKAEDREKLVETALKRYGKINILICNAAVNPNVGPLLETTKEMWDKVFGVNVISHFLMVKLVVPHMQKEGGGSIIICTSVAAFRPHPDYGPYCVSKIAQLGLTQVLAMALQPMNIRVNGLAIGLINTSFSVVLRNTPEMKKEAMTHFAISRFGEPEECGGIASFLCSPDASYINGENIAVSGGSRGRL
ncbi:dehydrogenase/reductase SDR family member 4-like isoform X1 [Ascaphus truei]|uniref:dehydrogenase/reductase SDR family member 4-like isoform X1 n=1 Tax=Ascaphus truei TaxID=8439 RepID=UPI003F59C605